MTAPETLETIRAERLSLVDRLRGLPDQDWQRPSLCTGWTVHHVLAHLVTPFTVKAPALAMLALRNRGLPGAMDAAARSIAAARPPRELLDILEANAGSTFRPPGMPYAAPLIDAVAHAADIRWAIGDAVADWDEPARLRPALDFLPTPRARVSLVPKGRLAGVSLVADDQNWRWGEGAEMRGNSLALLMAVLGRREALPAVSGSGIQRLFP